MRTRIAPTPSGYLHIGNAVNFLVTWAHARLRGGEVLLRIDDADPQMAQPGFEEDIVATLAWLGIDVDGRLPSQQTRYERYRAVLDELRAASALFACDCTRSAIRAASPDGTYPGTCRARGLPLDAPDRAWRVDIDGELPYPIVRGKSGLPGYHIASMCDDVDFAMTLIVRGEDLAPSSAAQRRIALLAPSLAPFLEVEIVHHALVTAPDGRKLSKSEGATTIASMRAQGESPASVITLAMGLVEGAPRSVLEELRDRTR